MINSIWLKILTWGTLLAPLTLFIYRHETVYPLVFLKIFIFQIIVELLFVLWLWFVLANPEYRPKLGVVHLVIAIWLGVLVLTALTGYNVEKSFWSTQDRSIGIVFILHAFAFALIVQTVARGFSWQKFMQYLTAIGSVMALVTVVNRVFPEIFFALGGDRPSGTLGNPSFLAGYLIFMVAIGGWLLLQNKSVDSERKKGSWLLPTCLSIGGLAEVVAIRLGGIDDVFYVVGLGLLSFGVYLYIQKLQLRSLRLYRIAIGFILGLYLVVLFLANTRGALLGLVAGVGVLLVWYAWRDVKETVGNKQQFYQRPAVIILAALLIFSGTFIATRSASLWQEIPGLNRLAVLSFSDTTVNNRKIVWGIALEATKERPLLGWGTDNFRYAFDFHYNPSLMRVGSDETYWDKPHNAYLESLVTTGIIGFVAYLAIFASLLFVLLRRRNSFTPIGIALLVAYGLQNAVLFDSFATFIMFFITAVFVADRAGEGSDESVVSKPISVVIQVVALTVAVLGVIWLLKINSTIIYANALQYKGLNYFANALPGEAIKAYRKGFSLTYPYSSEIRQNYVASLKQMMGQITIPDIASAIDLAINEYPAAIAKDPNNHFLYYTLADARTAFHRVDKKYLIGATDELNKADALSPHRQQIQFIRARINLALGDVPGAIKDMQTAIDYDPLVGEPHYFHAILSVGTASIDAINRELVQALDCGYQPKSLQELKLLFNYFMINEQYALGSDYFAELSYANNSLLLEQQLFLGTLSVKATIFDTARKAFERVKNEFPVFMLTERYQKEFEPMFKSVGVFLD
jgi:O-antigen ligase